MTSTKAIKNIIEYWFGEDERDVIEGRNGFWFGGGEADSEVGSEIGRE